MAIEGKRVSYPCARVLTMALGSQYRSRSVDREKKDLDKMMEKLGLSETNFDDVVFEELDQRPENSTRKKMVSFGFTSRCV